MKRVPYGAMLAVLALAGCEEPQAPPTFQGYVEGEYLRMSAPEGGWLETLAVRRGERVGEGDALFTLEASRERAAVAEAQSRLAQARAQLADLSTGRRPEEIAQIEARLGEARAAATLARSELARQRQLAERDISARARLEAAEAEAASAAARVDAVEAELAAARLPARGDQIEAAGAAVEAAQAALDQATWRLSQRAVASPAAALVEDTVRRPGEWVPTGGVVASLLPPDAVKLIFFVPEPHRAALQPGQELSVSCDGCEPGLRARLTFLAPEAEYTPPIIYSLETRAKLVFRAEAEPLGDAKGLLPGQPVTLTPGIAP